jgi:NAD(P)-dependent dehydrogenase (short-subunit alcohol dehydrogenase family)
MDLDNVYDFSNKVIVVTGGTGVLLKPTVRTMVELGGQVVLLSRIRDKDLMNEMRQYGKRPMFIPTDVKEKTQLTSAKNQIMKSFGRVDVLINGAGGNQPGATASDEQSFFDLAEDAVTSVFDVNFMGTFLSCQIFGEVMAGQGSGVILNISSVAAIKPLTQVVSYSAAKAAVDNLTQWLAVYMAQTYSEKIRVNALAPGFLLTEQNRYLLCDEVGELTQRGRQILTTTPMQRFGDPEEMVGAILWLVSDASRFVTGIVVPVDGGFSAYGGV